MSQSTQCLRSVVPIAVFLYFCFFVSLYFCILYLCGHCAAYVALLLSTLPKCQPPPWPPGRLPKHSSAKRCHDDEDCYKNGDDDNDDDYKNGDENRKACYFIVAGALLINFCYFVGLSVKLVASTKFE